MKQPSPILGTTVALTVVAAVAASAAAAQAKPDSSHPGYSAADVAFMSGMIYHHAQAVLIAGWAPSHDASPSVRTLCARIVVAQRDEITMMRHWLEDRHEVAPDPNPSHAGMSGMEHPVMMPGMLTAAQLDQLDHARGPLFDRLFLRFMIQHHQGAITMVDQLFGQGAGETETVFKFANDVFADQTTEIDRMQRMLATLLFDGRGQ